MLYPPLLLFNTTGGRKRRKTPPTPAPMVMRLPALGKAPPAFQQPKFRRHFKGVPGSLMDHAAMFLQQFGRM